MEKIRVEGKNGGMSDKARGNILVAVQFALLVAIFFTPSANSWALPFWAGLTANTLLVAGVVITGIAIFGLGKSLTANPVPKAKAVLKTGGLYAAVRHPIYSGLLLASWAFTAQHGSLWSLIAAPILTVLFAYKARFEERMLLATYPNYAAYAARVGRFVPWVGRLRGVSK